MVPKSCRQLELNPPRYRFYTALRPQLLCKERKDQSVDEFLQRFCYDSWDAALQDSSGMNAVMCAVMSGDTKMLKLLAQCRADMNHTLQGMGDLGYYDTQTVLMAATKSQQHPSVLQTLIELEADVNARARTGLVALYMCRSPNHVKALSLPKARNSQKGPQKGSESPKPPKLQSETITTGALGAPGGDAPLRDDGRCLLCLSGDRPSASLLPM